MLEYVTLLVFIMGALVIFGNYIIYGLTGKWKKTGESFGFGIHFIPQNSVQCRYDTYSNTGRWYDVELFDKYCDCFSLQQNSETCHDCILYNSTRYECDD